MSGNDEMTPDEKRHDQLTSAPDATEADAAPRIDVSTHDGVKRIDIRDDADVRPGGPEVPSED
ncbi:multidrug transporter [Microbacterium aquimaris]|uniref:Multidrug transporter n=1 Tax=Microbacterium aquimaris TaxID=459816 RepID=A0ABU5N4F9_9MICO|nr:multidrug transporter [Microbacterium aquimaris]MDZ8160956.1 multidrug transporter [Microbacterium aquimaris]